MHGPGVPFDFNPDRIDPYQTQLARPWLCFVAGRLCRMHMRLVAIAVILLMTACGTNAAVDDPVAYSVRCWEAGSLFADTACSCLGGSALA